MSAAIPVSEPVRIPVQGSDDVFPVRNIYCVGRNYWAHREEMGVSDRDPPFFFQKRPDGLVYCPPGQETEIPYPPMTSNFHHEIELVVAIGTGGKDIALADATSHIFGYAVGLDMTRRDLQGAAKEKGRPWDTGKNFEHGAPIGEIVPIAKTGPITDGMITLSVNGAVRQSAPMDEMIWSVNETIEDLSKYHTLYPGDLIYTGTPAGVGPVVSGDLLEGAAEKVGAISVRIG
ncbi:MAG: fumarylacetoacetate hydrolase family protein [Alphaproteobacteria bacterium]